MGFFSGLLMVGAAGLVLKGISDSCREHAEEERRKNIRCKFCDKFTQESFASVANQVVKGIKKKKIRISVVGPIVHGTVESQSGLSTWNFSVDFNDYGKISGKYWIKSQNQDSSIPKHIAEGIKAEIIKSI